MSDCCAVNVEQEEERIRAAYAMRGEDRRYSWLNPSYVFAMQSLEEKIAKE